MHRHYILGSLCSIFGGNGIKNCSNFVKTHILKILFQFILFGMGVNTGDPNRLLAGTDVAGNVCGRSNSPITNVSNSGLSMQGKKYLYFDWVRTAKILGQSSLNSVLTNTIGNFSTQFKKEFNIINVFCQASY